MSKQLFLNLHSLQEDIIEDVRERMESGKLKPTFRDVYYVSTAKDKCWQQAHRIEERREETGYTRNVVSQKDYEDILAKVREDESRLSSVVSLFNKSRKPQRAHLPDHHRPR